MRGRQGEGLSILLVEDDTVDVEAIRTELERHRVSNPVHTARDGQEALDMLKSGKISKPYLLLLDLNLPRMNGLELLRAMRADPALKSAIVFVITTSDSDEDKAKAYDFNVAGYIQKKTLGEDFMKIVHMCDRYWRVVEFPG